MHKVHKDIIILAYRPQLVCIGYTMRPRLCKSIIDRIAEEYNLHLIGQNSTTMVENNIVRTCNTIHLSYGKLSCVQLCK